MLFFLHRHIAVVIVKVHHRHCFIAIVTSYHRQSNYCDCVIASYYLVIDILSSQSQNRTYVLIVLYRRIIVIVMLFYGHRNIQIAID